MVIPNLASPKKRWFAPSSLRRLPRCSSAFCCITLPAPRSGFFEGTSRVESTPSDGTPRLNLWLPDRCCLLAVAARLVPSEGAVVPRAQFQLRAFGRSRLGGAALGTLARAVE